MCVTHCSPVCLVGTGQYWIIGGQHCYTACAEWRKEETLHQREVPQWCKQFRCRLIKPDTELAVLKKIAGRLQARDKTVTSMTFAQTFDYFWEKAEVWHLHLFTLL